MLYVRQIVRGIPARGHGILLIVSGQSSNSNEKVDEKKMTESENSQYKTAESV